MGDGAVTVTCPYCSAPADRVQTPWGFKYQCVPCDARVGCHPGSDKPLGTLANAELRKARMAAHAAFDPLWKLHGLKRSAAYAWLARKMGIVVTSCHVAHFNVDQCKQVVAHSKAFALELDSVETPTGVF